MKPWVGVLLAWLTGFAPAIIGFILLLFPQTRLISMFFLCPGILFGMLLADRAVAFYSRWAEDLR